MRKIGKAAIGAALAIVVLLLSAYLLLRASLPQLDGQRTLLQLHNTVRMERDGLGIVTISSTDRLDLARATGFAHAQDRFFQMDLLRRNASGELAELLGPAALPLDQKRRLFRMREAAKQAVQQMPDEDRTLLAAYVEGVNAGLHALDSRPFEYWLLQREPDEWRAEDSLLVLMTMFFGLSDARGDRELSLAALRAGLPPQVLRFLTPRGTQWDAPLMGGADDQPPALPSADIFDLRRFDKSGFPQLAARQAVTPYQLGSNNWAVAGAHVAGGGALVAGDMHLEYHVPHIWYRMRWKLQPAAMDITGVSLPGVPFMIAGSNRHIAWALTTTYGDWSDLVQLDLDPADARRYRTPEGWRQLERHHEVLHVRRSADAALDVDETIWGPVIHDAQGHAYAVHWLARVPGAVDLHCRLLESAADVAAAVAIAHHCGLPPQNFVVGDQQGHIAWTVAGRIPQRRGIDGSVPASWADGAGWDGFLDASQYPRVIDPPQGRVWSANARIADGEALKIIGTGNYALGARQRQIRDDLLAVDKATPADMLAVQLDDRALFLQRWQSLLLELLTPQATAGHPLRAQARAYIEDWGARADAASVGYRLVSEWRLRVHDSAFAALLAPCRSRNPDCKYDQPMFQSEGPLWQLVTQRPLHLLNPQFASWDAFLLAAFDAVITPYAEMPGGLAARSWGEHNTLRMRHTLSPALPLLSGFLDMPAVPMSGDNNLPRVQLAQGGASQRMAVSPGRETQGYMSMPGGQSGHPLSPFYRAGHEAWMQDQPTPFLPGVAKHVMVLAPAQDGSATQAKLRP